MDQVDHKALAAGERREELPQTQQRESLIDYAEEALDHVLIFTRADMTDKERVIWVERLCKYPKWKLMKLDEYPGPYINGLWKFLDDLSKPPQSYEFTALPEPQSGIAKDCLKEIKIFHAKMDYTPKYNNERNPDGYAKERAEKITAKRAYEKTALLKLHKKYPNAEFDKSLRAREQSWRKAKENE